MWEITGHDKAITFLERTMERNMLAHAYLLLGPRNIGKMNLAMNLAKAVNCLDLSKTEPCGICRQCERITSLQHTDVQIITLPVNESDFDSRREIGIDQIRDLQRTANLKPYEGKYKVFIFENADSLSDQAANALLKLLEEPPDSVLFVLISSIESSIKPTIASRCQKIELNYVPVKCITDWLQTRHNIPDNSATYLARLSMGRIGWAIAAATNPDVLDTYNKAMSRISQLLEDGLQQRFDYAQEISNLYTKNHNEALSNLNHLVDWWRHLLILKNVTRENSDNVGDISISDGQLREISNQQILNAINSIQDAMDYLAVNTNPRLSLESLMLSFPKAYSQSSSNAAQYKV